MGGFLVILKNQSIEIASRNGKAYIHSYGHTKYAESLGLGSTDYDLIEI